MLGLHFVHPALARLVKVERQRLLDPMHILAVRHWPENFLISKTDDEETQTNKQTADMFCFETQQSQCERECASVVQGNGASR